MNEPTEKQINAIKKLARSTNTDVDLNSITTKWEASKILDKLIAKRSGRSQNNNSDSRDRKAAYGLAVKLVLKRYQQLNIDYKKTGSFWKDVDEFYQQYLQHQNQALRLGSL